MDILAALILYPGLLTTLLMSVLVALCAGIRLPAQGSLHTLRRSPYGLTSLMSMFLVAAAALFSPWPLHPAATHPFAGNLLLAWIAFETAALLPLLPGFASGIPLAMRAASREAQLGIAGRIVVWASISVGSYAGSTIADLPGSLLALLAGLLALPAATGLGPFGPERSLAPDGPAIGLDEAGVALLPLVRLARAVGLIGLLISAAQPLSLMGTPVVIVLILLVCVGFGLVLRWAATMPRLTLPSGIAWCWWRSLPLAVAGLVYLIVT